MKCATHIGRMVGSCPGSAIRLVDAGEYWESYISGNKYSKTTGEPIGKPGCLKIDIGTIRRIGL